MFSSRDDAGAKALRAALRVLEDEIAANPREDMLAERPAVREENPRYVYRP